MKKTKTFNGSNRTPRVFQVERGEMTFDRKTAFDPNGPQEAFEALALPTYPLTPMGLASLPGRVA